MQPTPGSIEIEKKRPRWLGSAGGSQLRGELEEGPVRWAESRESAVRLPSSASAS